MGEQVPYHHYGMVYIKLSRPKLRHNVMHALKDVLKE